MPLLKRKPFSLLEPPKDLEPHELIFQIRFTKEIFRDYQNYLKRVNLYNKKLWTCKVTGKTNMTYEEALISEQHAAKKVQQFPEEFIKPVLQTVQYSMLPLSDLAHKIKLNLQGSLDEGAKLHGKKDGGVYPCRIVKVLEKEGEKTRYNVAWLNNDGKFDGHAVISEEDLVLKKLPFGREVLKSYIRESTYRSLPWVIHNNLASKYGISTDPPEDLKGKITVVSGCVVDNKKRKKNKEGSGGKYKKSKLEGNGYIDADKGNDSSKYPIEDQLVQSYPDDPVVSNRPYPLRDFAIQTDCVGDLLMVWDFCSSFGKFLYLWPYSLEDFEKAILHKDSNISLIVETHVSLLRLLIKDMGEYYTFLQEKKHKLAITSNTWAKHLCEFLEMLSISELTTHISTIKRGHYGLLDASTKLNILKNLVDQAVATNIFRDKIDEYIEQRRAFGALKRGEALEEAKMKREAKEHLKAAGSSPNPNFDSSDDFLIRNLLPNNGHVFENGHFSDKFSEDDHLLLSSESDHQVNGLREKTKKLLEELEKSKEQRKEFLQKEREKRVNRATCLGKDRDHNRYWFFRRDGRVFVESCDFKEWGYYCSKDVIDEVMSSLNPKGVRERSLEMQFERHYASICKEMEKRSKQVAEQNTKEDAVVRRSTRVHAPKNNPAKAFLKYSNKWKVLMD